jgi:hypothetical protein
MNPVPDGASNKPRIEPVQLLIAWLVVASPGLLTLAGLLLTDILPPPAAALGAGGCLVLSLVVARWHLHGLMSLRDYADRLLTSDEPPPPETRRFGPLQELTSAVARLHRGVGAFPGDDGGARRSGIRARIRASLGD